MGNSLLEKQERDGSSAMGEEAMRSLLALWREDGITSQGMWRKSQEIDSNHSFRIAGKRGSGTTLFPTRLWSANG